MTVCNTHAPRCGIPSMSAVRQSPTVWEMTRVRFWPSRSKRLTLPRDEKSAHDGSASFALPLVQPATSGPAQPSVLAPIQVRNLVGLSSPLNRALMVADTNSMWPSSSVAMLVIRS